MLAVQSFLTAYALCAVFHPPLVPAQYETTLDYVIASIYELLGDYDLKFLFLFILTFCFYAFRQDRLPAKQVNGNSRNSSYPLLSCFFALCLLLGQSYREAGDSSYCFGSAVNFVRFSLALAGLGIFLRALLELFHAFLDSRNFISDGEHFFTRHAFRKSFLILTCAYAPFLLLAFPGKLCWDAIGQIEQVLGGAPYSTHHPLFHTLIMGGFVKGGQSLLHSPELGLFGYMLLQDALLVGALSATVAVLARRGASPVLLRSLLLLYCITPIYSNMASTALKDVPYASFAVGYVICLALLLEQPEKMKQPKFVFLFFLIQTGVILLRNNGMYVVLLSGIGCLLFLWKKYSPRERLLCFFSSFGGSIATARLILALLVWLCSASPGSVGEMFSVPFQQTARYLQLYRTELSQEELEGIEGVLGDIDTIAASYNPDSSDPVKALFDKNASAEDLKAYAGAWFQGFLKHPGSYFEAFLNHVYGWFTPSVSNTIRYEADDYEAVRQGGLFPNAEKLLIFYYRFAGRITPLGILENIGAAVWALFFLTLYQKKHGQTASMCAGLPLWVSLLVCMASPCFYNHPRYAFPILFSIPFLYGFTLTGAASRGDAA